MKAKMVHRALVTVLVLLMAAAILPAEPALAQTVCFQVNGEGLADGTPIPGWNLVFGGPPAIATVTATANPAGIHSGSRGVRVNGDYLAGKEFDIVAKGVVTVDYWHYPRPGTSTNSYFTLCGGNHPGGPDAYLHEGVDYWRYLTVWKNDQDLWWIQSEEVPAPSVASYSGSYTHIVVTIDTNSGLFDLNIGGNLVYQGTVDHADKIGAFGIRYVAVHSGRGGGGTDSYFDDILITATETAECVATTTSTGTACFTTSNGTIEDLTAVATPYGAPVQFPHGMFTFRVTGLSPGETITLTVELPDPVPVGTKWWKYHNSVWSPMNIGDDDGDNIITVMLQDGRTPDDEDTIPGQITDQGGPGAPSSVGWETYPISKVRVFLPWIALLAAIVVGALIFLRRRLVHS